MKKHFHIRGNQKDWWFGFRPNTLKPTIQAILLSIPRNDGPANGYSTHWFRRIRKRYCTGELRDSSLEM
jgi:hypothetical protein